MAQDNPLWGAPRIHGELLKLGMEVSQATVAKYVSRSTPSPSQSWRTFLANHVGQIVAADFLVVLTATCRLLFVLVLLARDRRRIVPVAVTSHPTAAWTAQQFREAFPWDQAPRYLIHDRDLAFQAVAATAKAMGIEVVRTAPRSPWQNAYVERFIVSLRRECLDHVIVLNAAGLRTIVKSYVTYYTNSRTHLWLGKDSPISRPISPVGNEPVIAIPEVGGLHHRYERRAAYSASSDLLHDRLQRLSRSIRAHRLTWRGARAATVRKSGGAFVDVVIVGRKAGTIVPAAWAAMRQAHWSRPTEFSAGTTPFPLRQLRLAARVPFIADRRLCHHDL